VYRILRPEGRKLGYVVVPFDAETRVTGLKAWSLSREGKEDELKDRDAIETGLSEVALYSDERRKLLKVPGVGPGRTIAYEYEQRQRPRVWQQVWSFQQDIPVRRARFRLEAPPGWEVTAFWRNYPAQPPQVTGTKW